MIAGSFDGHDGPARTFSPMNVWDVRLDAGKTVLKAAKTSRIEQAGPGGVS